MTRGRLICHGFNPLLVGVALLVAPLLAGSETAAEQARFRFVQLNLPGPGDLARVAVADVDADGRLDIVVVSGRFADGKTHVLYNRGAQGWHPVAGPFLGEVSVIDLADLDADGLPELLVGYGKDLVQVLPNVDGEFGRKPRLNIGLVPHYHHALLAGDVNGDGHVDLLVSHSWGIKRFLGEGELRFGPGRTVNRSGYQTRALALFDADADGKPDLIACHGAGPTLYRNLGWGAFAADGQPLHGGSAECQTLGVVDIDADGRPELLASTPFPMLFRSRPCAGDGGCSGFGDAIQLPHGRTVRVADFDLDGTPDLLSADTRMHILAGAQNGDYAQPELIPAAFARSVLVADMDADGDPDLLVLTEMHYLLLLANQVNAPSTDRSP